MNKSTTDKSKDKKPDSRQTTQKPLTVEVLEARIAPALATDKKQPTPPPYPPGTRYGLLRRDNLRR